MMGSLSNTTPVTVIMTEEEAAMFVLMQKHYKFMQVLDDAGAFTIKGGSVTIHFDNQGNVGSLDLQRRYKIVS